MFAIRNIEHKKNRPRCVAYFLSICLLIILTGCSKNDALPPENDLPEKDPMPLEANNNWPIEEDVPDEETSLKEYDFLEACLAEAYFDVLTENSLEKYYPDDKTVAILDVFEDDTPELLYIDWHDYKTQYNDEDFIYPVLSLNIFTYSNSEGAEFVFDTILLQAAGGPNNYCVYLTREGNLMLYLSVFHSGLHGWGFWQITPNQNLEIKEHWRDNNIIDLAKLYYCKSYDEDEAIFKSNGVKISVEQYDETAREIMGDIDRVIFQNVQTYELDDLWMGTTPIETYSITYTEAIAWLETQRNIQ